MDRGAAAMDADEEVIDKAEEEDGDGNAEDNASDDEEVDGSEFDHMVSNNVIYPIADSFSV